MSGVLEVILEAMALLCLLCEVGLRTMNYERAGMDSRLYTSNILILVIVSSSMAP